MESLVPTDDPALTPRHPFVEADETDADQEDDGSETDEESSLSSNSNDFDYSVEDESYPHELAVLDWELATGKAGHLHLVDCQKLYCGRILRLPESGTGLALAARSNRKWSPRCWRALPETGKAWWLSSADTKGDDVGDQAVSS
jgi:hypothetical protein